MALPLPRASSPPPPHDPQMPFRGGPPPKKGGKGKSPGKTPPAATSTPPTPPPLSDADLIQQMITAAQLPSLQAIQNSQSASELASKNQATTTQGYYEALAQALSQIGARTQAGYSQAAGSDAAFGKGFSDGLAQAQGQAGAQTSDALGVAGAPASQTAQATAALGGTGATDALYALGGYIPATTLNREGAAFGAAANLLPATAAAQGAQTIQQIGNQQRVDQQGFAKQFADLAAQVPGLSLQFGQQLQSMHAATQAEQNKMDIANAHESDVHRQQALTKYIADLNAGVSQQRATASYIAATGEYPDGTPTAKTAVAQHNANTAAGRAATAATQGDTRNAIAQQNANTAAFKAAASAAAAAKTTGGKPPTAGQLSTMVDGFYDGKKATVRVPVVDANKKPVVDPKTGVPRYQTVTQSTGKLNFLQAYKRLRALHVSDVSARQLLDTVYKRGERKRAWLTNEERAVLERHQGIANHVLYYQGQAWITAAQVITLRNAGALPPGEQVGGRYFIAPGYD